MITARKSNSGDIVLSPYSELNGLSADSATEYGSTGTVDATSARGWHLVSDVKH